jgi:N-methylhydantoinase A/oxoprolinase/acetone carboxylase beta subunit
MAKIIVDRLTYQTGQALLSTAFAEEEAAYNGVPTELAQNELLLRGLARASGLVKLEAGLNVDVIGLGASASTYYPAVGKALHCNVILPEHAGVANAIGAVVGRITMRRTGTVTSPSEGVFRVHFKQGPKDFLAEDDALKALENYLILQAETDVRDSGSGDIQTRTEYDIRRAWAESSDVFIEATVSVESSGRPRVSD